MDRRDFVEAVEMGFRFAVLGFLFFGVIATLIPTS